MMRIRATRRAHRMRSDRLKRDCDYFLGGSTGALCTREGDCELTKPACALSGSLARRSQHQQSQPLALSTRSHVALLVDPSRALLQHAVALGTAPSLGPRLVPPDREPPVDRLRGGEPPA